MSEYFPSTEWLETYRERLNENDRYAAASDGWGEDFDGDFVFTVTDLPLSETAIGDLPPGLVEPFRRRLQALPRSTAGELVAGAPPALRDRMTAVERSTGADGEAAPTGEASPTVESAPQAALVHALFDAPVAEAPDVTWPALLEHAPDDLETLLGELETYVNDDTVYAYLDLVDGDCREVAVLERPPDRDTGFGLEAEYGEWVALVEGADVLESVFSQAMALDGSVTTILGYSEAAQAMGDTASEIDTTYLF